MLQTSGQGSKFAIQILLILVAAEVVNQSKNEGQHLAAGRDTRSLRTAVQAHQGRMAGRRARRWFARVDQVHPAPMIVLCLLLCVMPVIS